MDASSSLTNIILNDERDWREWLEVIETLYTKHQLWKYIDPSIPLNRLPTLVEPSIPTPVTIRGRLITSTRDLASLEQAGATLQTPSTLTFTELTGPEQAEYTRQHEVYLLERKEYTKRIEAMGDLRTRIQTTIAQKNFQYTRNYKGVLEMMAKLRVMFALTDKVREIEVLST
jgi:hypothetical protein